MIQNEIHTSIYTLYTVIDRDMILGLTGTGTGTKNPELTGTGTGIINQHLTGTGMKNVT